METLVLRTVNVFGSTIAIAISLAQLIQHKAQVRTILQHSLVILLLDLSTVKRISLRRGSHQSGSLASTNLSGNVQEESNADNLANNIASADVVEYIRVVKGDLARH